MISYTLKKFTIQLIDFVNNLLAPVEGFNRYQIFGKKKVARGSRTQASAIRKLRVTTAFTLPVGVDQELVKKCALKKMALAFATFKKKLYINYIKKDKEPN